ncbi:acetoacetate decarboxylase family protein [Actinoplanes sp. TBRC 11911]|uniref:acetoacetate decarboxylase family protein n=1 Tax=Actinoplanes sp. TBRC 11911 TaxID=2729386 RepID=UPI001B7D6756|nr:acetoacetate decarboxylase family protein [Actinoplanes sp. TBRC 11911]
MAELVGPDTWAIQGETITLPLSLHDARLTAAVFTCPAAGASSVLAPTPLKPLVVGGRAISVLMCIHYGEWPLKAYDEVGVGVFVRGRPPGLHIVDLPVTGAFTREAGRDFWGLPKWVMDADLSFASDRTSVVVRSAEGAEGAEVMRAEFAHGRRFPGVPAALPAWSYLEEGAQAGRLLRGWLPARLSRVRLGRGPFSVRLPSGPGHPMAARMRSLGMLGRPLFTVHAERLSGRLGSFTPVASRA